MGKVFVSLLALGLAGLAFAVWFNEVRVIVVPPMPAAPEGRTIVVAGLRNFNLIDSAEAACRRRRDYSQLCQPGTLMAIAKESKILFRLPYFSALDSLTGANRL